MREQINRERGLYVSKDELTSAVRELRALINPVTEFVAAQAGKAAQGSEQRLNLNAVVGVLALLVTAGIMYAAFHH